MLKNSDVAGLLEPQFPIHSENAMAVDFCRERLLGILGRMQKLVAPETVARVDYLTNQLDNFSVRASLIGQVKAGKTALTNAMIGSPNLLPSDVNPWTSVITSIHMNTKQPRGKNAVFSFFTTDQWNGMTDVGGHMGEIAERANYEEELREIKGQIMDMQRRTKARLGHNFELLLNNYHSFCGFGPELIKKYVCLGDDEGDADGRYADLTRSADLYIDHPNYSLPTVLCDTPGVNDPFLMREAVTLDNLSSTDICVIVLSAHQAFSTVDLGLIRILMALKNEQIVLYVNRIDELQDIDRQVEEIDSFIRELLAEQNLPVDLPIVFGSAAWGEMATSGLSEAASDHSMQTLAEYAEQRRARLEGGDVSISGEDRIAGSTASTLSKTSDLSGVYELQHILMEKSALDIGRPFIAKIRDQALDVTRQASLYLEEASSATSSLRSDLDIDVLIDDLDIMLVEADDACHKIASDLSEKVLFMMSGAFREFMIREKASLKDHMAQRRDISEWKTDGEALRRELNIAHDEFVGLAPRQVTDVFEATAAKIERIYAKVLDDNARLFAVHAPKAPVPNTPVSLMRTMAVDMSAGWFSTMFSKKMALNAHIKRFDTVAKAEMAVTLDEMRHVYVEAFMKATRAQLHDFLAEHIQTLQNLSLLSGSTQRVDILSKLGVETEIRQRLAELEGVVGDLESLFQRPSDGAVTDKRTAA